MEFYCGLTWMPRRRWGRGGRSVISLAGVRQRAAYDTNTMPLWPYQGVRQRAAYDTNTMPQWPYQGVRQRAA